ncbi:MAG: sensor histidine kinase, partial [Flavobacteriales bacterium]
LTAEKKRSQNRALQVLKENERIVREQNALLEEKVKERTKELEKSNQDLNVAYKSLQTTQSQLVEAEKMAGLGQMTAGIAHELNNPINYVSSNVNPLKRDVDEVFHVLDEYKSFTNKHESDAEVGKIRSLEKELDLPFLRIEIGQLLNGIREGAERSAAIVKGLRTFSRLDEDTLKLADINDGLESTLVILKSNYKGQCEVVKKLDPNLPQVECFPGKLNQVFMNILNNAIQASVDSNSESPKVRVSTTTAGGEVKVHIADNGAGMSGEVKSRIFEPFFTTKKVGEGTGLGLSIVLGIIEQHNGTIHVESAPGKGTEFVITLPLKPA